MFIKKSAVLIRFSHTALLPAREERGPHLKYTEVKQMLVYVNIKQVGSRKKALAHQPYEIDFETGSLADLIAAFTRNEVDRYNTAQEISRHNEALKGEDTRLSDPAFQSCKDPGHLKKRTASPQESIRIALEGFADGLVRILKNDAELTDLNQIVTLQEGDVFTFIRLTFLAGRMW